MKLFRYASQTLKRVLGHDQAVDASAMSDGVFSLGDVAINEADIVVSAYPCSGGEQLMQSLSVLAAQFLPEHTESTATSSKIDLTVQFQHPAKLVATRKPFDPRMHTCVFVYRDAAETLCENYLQLTANGAIPHEETIDEFCLSRFNEWYAHTESYLNSASQHDCDLFTIAFESFVKEKPRVLYEVSGFIELDTTFQQCHAISVHSQLTTDDSYSPTAVEQLESETYNTIQNQAQPLYRRAMMIDIDSEAA